MNNNFINFNSLFESINNINFHSKCLYLTICTIDVAALSELKVRVSANLNLNLKITKLKSISTRHRMETLNICR